MLGVKSYAHPFNLSGTHVPMFHLQRPTLKFKLNIILF